MTFLRVDSSIRHQGSVSREVTAVIERTWRAAGPDTEVVHRDLGEAPTLADPWRQAAIADFVPEPQRSRPMRDAVGLAARMADEVLAADAIAVGAPLYNFGVPTTLKSWLDLLIIDPRLNPRHTPVGQALAGVPVSLVVVCGGGYGPGAPREGWDHSSPYLRRVFADVFGAEVTLIAVEFTAVDTDPALAGMRPRAERSRAEALALAEATAAEQAGRVRAGRTAAAR